MRLILTSQRVIRLAAAAIALAIASPAAHAQQPSAASMLVAKEIVTTTGATVFFNPLVAGVIEQAKNLFLQQDPGLSRDANEISEKMLKDLTPRMSEIADEVARLYATRFSEKELKELLAFYKSPVGKKLLVEQPKVVDGSLKFAQDWANKLSEEVMVKMRDELKKKGHAL
jgi:hypothetical protein